MSLPASNEFTRNTRMEISPVHVQQPCSVMSISPRDHKHMKQLVAMASDVEEAGFPPLGNPRHINDHSHEIKQPHANLVPERLHTHRLVVEEDDLVRSRDDSRHPHGCESDGSHGAVLRRLEDGDERDGHRCDSYERDPGEVDVSPDRLAEEDVVNWREEARGDHGGDPGVVEAP